MKTKFLVSGDVEEAAAIIKTGGLLGIPTETVYGLGANGLNASAVRKIFEAKGRAQDNPLILHIPDESWLERYCEDIPEIAYKLADEFWPGPLTMILKAKPVVPKETTGGLSTVGMRCPDNNLTRKIIAMADVPVAAPSANLSGRPSCTSFDDVVEDMNGKIEGIIDGGDCRVGVESTIIDLTISPPQILRPGGLPLERIRNIIGDITIDKAVYAPMKEGETPRAPGMKYRHYAPVAPVTVVEADAEVSKEYILRHLRSGDGVICFEEFRKEFEGYEIRSLGGKDSPEEHAHAVFDSLRDFDRTNVNRIWAQCPKPIGVDLAVVNRLKKAAGFHVVDGNKRMVVFGITGGTGSGKTTALNALEELGGEIIDTDAVYHQLTVSCEPMREELSIRYGDIWYPDGTMDRKKLGNIVFRDDQALLDLNKITHKYIDVETTSRIEKAEQKGLPAAACDAIALFESGLAEICDYNIAITAPRETRIRRIMKRDNISREYAESRVDAQKSDDFYKEHCDYVLVNDYDSSDEFKAVAKELFAKLIGEFQEV